MASHPSAAAGRPAQVDHQNRQPTIHVSNRTWDPKKLPRRKWIAEGYFLRGALTVLVGPGGVSKSSLALTWIAHMAVGASLHRLVPSGPMRVLYLNVEDDLDEQKRRLSAVVKTMGHTENDIAPKIMLVSPTVVGTLLVDSGTGTVENTSTMDDLEKLISIFHPDVVVLDPMVEIHTADENSNVSIRAVCAKLRALAVKHNLAILLIHHTRKGVLVAGDVEAARGASAIVGASRVVLTAVGMSEKEEIEFGLPFGKQPQLSADRRWQVKLRTTDQLRMVSTSGPPTSQRGLCGGT
jgi:RecA-family ATPase